MKRIMLFLLTNLAVMLVLSITASILGVNRWLTANGMDFGSLLAFAALLGFGGAIISLLMSKFIAKMSVGAHVIEAPQTADEQWIVSTVRRYAEKAGIGMPEVAIYEGAPNAFATGAFRDSALVAVSTGLLESMTRDEVDAVIGHEVAHIANGDMVTLTLIQGVVNTFVIFMARVVGFFVDKVVFKTERGVGPGFMITVIVCEIVFGILASIIVAWFSRYREFRADAGSAQMAGSPRNMIAALRRLGGVEPDPLPQALQSFGIAEGGNKFLALFSSHPPIQERIAALEGRAA
ncbi:MAG TPA: protease HtpX [Usitatibacter sp.]|nr:protease HtpX [Usitatibacter sp.]